MKDLVKQIESTSLELLEGKQTVQSLTEKMNEIIEKVNQLQTGSKRDRGPKSERDMTEEDARRIMLGDLSEKSHKAAAEELGLSYGQIYSARGGYTFKKVYKEWKESRNK